VFRGILDLHLLGAVGPAAGPHSGGNPHLGEKVRL
jgi:hypothetical protein